MPGKKKKTRLEIGEKNDETTLLPTSSMGRPAQSSLREGGQGFERRDYAAEEGGDNGGEADFVDDWRGAAATAQPEDDTAGGRRGAPDEAESWDFRQIDRQGTDASDKQAPDRQESWDFRQIERQGTDASENRAPERQESWDFRQIDRHGTDAPEKQEPDRKESWDFRQIEREPTQNTKQGQKWEEIRNRARQEENRSTEDRADIGEKFAALRTGEGSTAAAVGNGDYKLSEMRNGRVERWRPSRRTEDSTESAKNDSAAEGGGDKWASAFKAGPRRIRSTAIGRDVDGASDNRFGGLKDDKLEDKDKFSRAFSSGEKRESSPAFGFRKDGPPSGRFRFDSEMPSNERSRSPRVDHPAFGVGRRGVKEEKEVKDSSFTGRPQNVPAAFANMGGRREDREERDSPFMGRKQKSTPAAFASMDNRREERNQPMPTNESNERPAAVPKIPVMEESKPAAAKTQVNPKEEIKKAATEGTDKAKATARRYITSMLDNYMVDMSMDATDTVLKEIEEKIPVNFRHLSVFESLLYLRNADIGRETRQVQSLFHALLDNTEILSRTQFWKGFGVYLLEASREEEFERIAEMFKQYVDKGNLLDVKIPSLEKEEFKKAKEWVDAYIQGILRDENQEDEATLEELEQKCRDIISQGLKGSDLRQFVSTELSKKPKKKASAALMRAILEKVHSEGLLSVRAGWCSQQEFGSALQLTCSSSTECGVSALRTLQDFFWEFEHIKKNGLMEGTFLGLFKEAVIPEDSFFAWKDDTSQKVSGKRDAIFKTMKFFSWLEEQKNADTEDDGQSDSEN